MTRDRTNLAMMFAPRVVSIVDGGAAMLLARLPVARRILGSNVLPGALGGSSLSNCDEGKLRASQ
jgi:hypothetical protein